MLISTQTSGFANKFGDHDAIKLLAKVGFDALDYSMFHPDLNHPLLKDDYREYAKSLKETAEEYNIIFNQAHAPFPSYIQEYEKGHKEYNETIVHAIVRAIEFTSILGGKIIIVHPITLVNHSYNEQKDFNIKFYNNLLPYCKKFNVKIALENIWFWDEAEKNVIPAAGSAPLELIDYLDSLEKDWFCACLDIGHAEMQGTGSISAADFINALGNDRLKAIHLHDNDKIKDLHNLPFMNKINFDEVMTALKNINYDGELTFEADGFIDKFPVELFMSASALMLDAGRYFVKKYNL